MEMESGWPGESWGNDNVRAGQFKRALQERAGAGILMVNHTTCLFPVQKGCGVVWSAATDRTMSLLATESLVKAYRGRRVVNGVSIRVAGGEIVGLLGPNGAGKTTTFNMVVGLVRPDAGEVTFAGQVINGLPMHRRARLGIGYLTQEPSVFRKLTVEQNILAILETCRMSRGERQTRLKYLLDELDLSRLAKSKAYTLSGGEKRRLEITRALVTSPRLLLLDEPFSGIDPIAVYEVQKILRRLKGRGLGILITDHNVRETLKLVDRACLIHHGEVLCEGSAEYLVNDAKAREIYLGPDFNL
jgi:lipopolysaccharide export system ATP-binding protein